MDRADRAGEVLAPGDERVQDPRHRGSAGRGGRRAEGFPQGNHDGVSGLHRANPHRSSHSVLAAVSFLEGTKTAGQDAEGYLQRPLSRAAASEPDRFKAGPYGERFAAVAHSWRWRWEEVIPFFAFSPEVRRIIYTTSAIESLHSQVRKAIRNKGHFPSDKAATKLIYLALRNITAKWKNPPRECHAAKAQFAIQFDDRFVLTD